MRVTVDPNCDMGYIYLTDEVASDHVIEVKDRGHLAFIIDINKEGRLVGIEVFNASKRLPVKLLEIAEKP